MTQKQRGIKAQVYSTATGQMKGNGKETKVYGTFENGSFTPLVFWLMLGWEKKPRDIILGSPKN